MLLKLSGCRSLGTFNAAKRSASDWQRQFTFGAFRIGHDPKRRFVSHLPRFAKWVHNMSMLLTVQLAAT